MTTQKHAIAEIIELLSKKWVMRIIWELRGGSLTFRELQTQCGGVSPTVINNRLKLLQSALLLEKDAERGYRLTEIGQELLEIYDPLSRWATAWELARQR